MVSVYFADTGQTVVIHEATQTVVVADDFDTALARLKDELGEDADRVLRAAAPPGPPQTKRSWSVVHYGALLFVALLPFVWLGALHASLGGLVVGLRTDLRAEDRLDLSDEVEVLQRETNAIGRKVHKLTDSLAKLKSRKPAKARVKGTEAEPAEGRAAGEPAAALEAMDERPEN